MPVVLAIAAVLAIIYAVPLVVYGVASILGKLSSPSETRPARFLLGVLVTKLGTAVAFVFLLQLTADAWVERGLLHALLWFGMFAASEVGDAVSGRSGWNEAWLGIISEAVYTPLSAIAAFLILRIGQ